MATKKKNTSKAAAAEAPSEAPAKRSSSSSPRIGDFVTYRMAPADPDDDAELVTRPAIVFGVTEGGPAPKGSREEDDATFLDLVVFGQGDQASSIVRSVRDGDGPGTWTQE